MKMTFVIKLLRRGRTGIRGLELHRVDTVANALTREIERSVISSIRRVARVHRIKRISMTLLIEFCDILSTDVIEKLGFL